MIELPFIIDSGASDHHCGSSVLLSPHDEISDDSQYDPPIDLFGAGSIVLKERLVTALYGALSQTDRATTTC